MGNLSWNGSAVGLQWNVMTVWANPWTVAVMVGLGYLVWLAIAREASPFARSSRRSRRNVYRLGRRCALVVALSWIVTLPPPVRSLAGDVIESGLATAALLLPWFLFTIARELVIDVNERRSSAAGAARVDGAPAAPSTVRLVTPGRPARTARPARERASAARLPRNV